MLYLFEVSGKLMSVLVLVVWSPVLWFSWCICLSLHPDAQGYPAWLACPPEINCPVEHLSQQDQLH